MQIGRGWACTCVAGWLLATMVAPAWAQSSQVTPEDEYKDLIRVSQDIQPLGEHPFGANISLYNGALSFEQVDVSASGNGPLLQLVRRFTIQDVHDKTDNSGQPGTFGDWELALPRIETLSAKSGFAVDASGYGVQVRGWDVGTASADDFTKRCSHFGQPPSVSLLLGDPATFPWSPEQWWRGYHLIIPGAGSQSLLGNTDSQTKATYPVVTKHHWRFSCLSSVANASTNPDTNGDGVVGNGQPYPTGEGFLGIAPDGTKYWFNELVYQYAPSISRPLYDPGLASAQSADITDKPLWARLRDRLGNMVAWLTGSSRAEAVPNSDIINRSEAVLLVTKIEDRFGNTLIYSYNNDGYLTAITASDGRKLTVQYVNGTSRIQSVTLQPSSGTPRVWTYTYQQSDYDETLTAVTLPNGQQWHFDMEAFADAMIAHGTQSSCVGLGPDGAVQSAYSGSITHPSGLKGTFTVKAMRHGQWNTLSDCVGMEYARPDTSGSHVTVPYAWYTFTITDKTFSGAGLTPAETWHYTYQPSTQSWANHDCSGSCDPTTWTNVRNPDDSTTHYVFNNNYRITSDPSHPYDHRESLLMETDYHAGAATGTPVRKVVNTYADPDTAPLPPRAGIAYQDNVNYAQLTNYFPLQKRVIHQDGDTYTWQAETFDKYAHVTETKRLNSIAGQQAVETQITYLNDTTNWVLGLPDKRTNLTTGEVVRDNSYNGNDLLTARTHFGQIVMTYMWNTAGQLASFTAPATSGTPARTTTLSDYKRGIPQTIVYPTTSVYDAAHPNGIDEHTSQRLVVDEFGQITSITDQAGHTTHYAYDAVGRLTQITYPTGSEAWYPKTFTYQYVTGAQRGITGGHWKRTVSQGNARHATWYDVLLRPVLTDTYISGDGTSHISASITYNWKGLTTFQSWPVAGSPALSAITAGTTTTYDALGRVTSVSQPSDLGAPIITTTAYLSGARKRITDPEGHITTLSYQVFDQPSYKAVTQVQAPENITQTITRNLYGAPTAITQSGPDGLGGTVSLTKTYYYDGQHRLCRTAEPETGSTLMGYDAAGNLLWSADGQMVSGSGCGSAPADSTTRTWDAMNRLTAVAYPDGQGDTTTNYDALGRVRSIQAMTASGPILWTHAYDTLGHLTDETLGVDGYSWPIHYTYAASGALSQITYPDGKQVAYAPDALGRPTKAGAYATNVSYFPDGTLKYFLYMGGQDSYLATRNARHLLENLTVGNGSTLVYSADFTYDKAGNITVINDLTDDRRDKTLSYDALNRLTAATAPNLWGTKTYTYDALNNIRQLGAHTYTYDAENHLTAIKNGSIVLHDFTYNAQGDVTTKDKQTRDFDEAHRLVAIPSVASYAYDAAGRRVKKIDAGGSTTYYGYNGAGHLMYQWDAATDMATDYIYLGKKLVAKVKRNQGDAVLNAPGISIDTNPNNGSFTVSWSAITNASYTLQEQTNGGGWHAAYSGTATRKTETGKAGGSYRYRVRACDGSCSDWSVSTVVGVTPAKPAISVPTGTQSGRYTVSWNRPVSTTSFDVQEQANGGTWQTIANDTTATSVSLAGDQDGSYAYRVRASNTYGTRGWVTSDPVTVLHPPASAPSLSLPATNSTGSYTVSWGGVSGASSYTLQQQRNGGSWSTVYQGTSTSKAISGLTNGTYGYRIQACNDGGCGPWSATSSVTVLHPPAAPASVDVPAISSGSVAVDWPASSTATSYTLQHRQSSGSWSNAYSGSATSKTVVETTTGSYTYRVEACNASGCGNWRTSSAVTVTIPPSSKPTLNALGTSSTGNYTVSWGSVSGASSYTLQEQVNEGGWSTAYDGGSRSTSYSGKTNGADYGYRVRACNTGGCGPWSATQTVSIAIPPAKPTGVYANDIHFNYKKEQLVIVWNAVSGASSYNVKDLRTGTNTNTVSTSATVYDGYPPAPPDSYTVQSCNAWACSDWVNATRRDMDPAPGDTPSLSVPSSDGNGNYTVSWGSVYRANRYILEQQVDGGAWVEQYDGANRSKAESGTRNGTYGYHVRACTSGGCGPWSSTQTVTVLHPPATPASIQVPASSDESVPVDWSASSTATRYTLQHRKGSGSWSNAYSGGATIRTVTETSTGSYSYRVHACNGSGCSGWRTSQAVAVTVPPSDSPSLSVPASDSNGSYTVSWGSVSGASSYTLQQKVNSGSWHTQYSGSGRSKAYSGKTNGADYGYRVRACNAGGCGPWSGTQTVSIAIPPARPTGVYANHVYINDKYERLTIVWNAVSGASSYNVKDLRTGAVSNSTSTSQTIYFGKPPVPFDSYAVQSCNAWACSAWVNADRRNVYPAPIRAPSLNVPATDGNGNYTVSWGSVSYTSSYTLQQRVNGGSWHTQYSGASRSKAFSGQSNGTYGYRVRACNASGCGPWSGTHNVTVSVLLNVTGLTATVTREKVITPWIAAGQPAPVSSAVDGTVHPMRPPPPDPTYIWYVTSNWNEATGANHYEVKVHNTANGTTHTYNVSTTYLSAHDVDNQYVEVSARACNANGCTAWVGPVDPTVEYY